MASFPSSWIIDAGEPSKALPSRAIAAPSSSKPQPSRRDLLHDISRSSRSSSAQFTSTSVSGVSGHPLPESKGCSNKPNQSSYPISFPTEWLLTTPTTPSSNSRPIYQNIARGTRSQTSFTPYMSAITSASMLSTPTNSKPPVQRDSLAPAESSKVDNTTIHNKQGDTLVERPKRDPVAPAGKEKQEEMSKWLQAVDHTDQRLTPWMGGVIANEKGLTNHDEVRDRDDLSDYSGLGDAPHNALDVSDNYSMYTESAYHSNIG